MKPILEVHKISKRYQIQHIAGGYLSLRERIQSGFSFEKTRKEEFFALDDISFDVHRGESVGIIGRNGAGKSTLLKILSRITPPSSGKIVTRGRIASLLEVGTGFHPELTGRENVYFNGSLLGMKRKEIDSKFDEIVDFSGVEKFLDTPLKHYSSGMQLRLAFAVAAFLEPEILVIDEVLAVGDAEFQKKCLGKMEDVTRSGRTILFVSHNMAAVENLCRKGVLLGGGKIIEQGSIQTVIGTYQHQLTQEVSQRWMRQKPSNAPMAFEFIEVEVTGAQPNLKLELKIRVTGNGDHPMAFVAFDVMNSFNSTFMQAIPVLQPFIPADREDQEIDIEIDLPPLVPDKYYVSAWLGPHNTTTYDFLREVVSFDVLESPTPGRTFPHTHDHGMIVPFSSVKTKATS